VNASAERKRDKERRNNLKRESEKRRMLQRVRAVSQMITEADSILRRGPKLNIYTNQSQLVVCVPLCRHNLHHLLRSITAI